MAHGIQRSEEHYSKPEEASFVILCWQNTCLIVHIKLFFSQFQYFDVVTAYTIHILSNKLEPHHRHGSLLFMTCRKCLLLKTVHLTFVDVFICLCLNVKLTLFSEWFRRQMSKMQYHERHIFKAWKIDTQTKRFTKAGVFVYYCNYNKLLNEAIFPFQCIFVYPCNYDKLLNEAVFLLHVCLCIFITIITC